MRLSFFLYPTSPGFISCDKPELVRGTEPIIGPPLHLNLCHSLFPPISYHLDPSVYSCPAVVIFPLKGKKKSVAPSFLSLSLFLSPSSSPLSRAHSLSFPGDPHRNHQSSFFGGFSHSGKKGKKTPLLDPREIPISGHTPNGRTRLCHPKPPQQRNAPDPVGHCFSSQ